jgi:hypothetical protein
MPCGGLPRSVATGDVSHGTSGGAGLGVGTYEESGILRHGEPLFTELDGRRQDLLQTELAAAEALDRVGPSRGGPWHGGGVDAGHGNLPDHVIGQAQVFTDRLERALAARPAGPVQGRHGAGFGVVEETKHVAADAGRGGLRHVKTGG